MITIKFKNPLKIFVGIFLILFVFIQDAIGKDKKFQVEVYGGFSIINPTDLNALVEADRQLQQFIFDNYLNYIYPDPLDSPTKLSWARDVQGGYKKVKNVLPFGIRVKFHLNSVIALSIGYKILNKDETKQYMYNNWEKNMYYNTYFNTYGNPREYFLINKEEYSPYDLSVEGHAPLVGIHVKKRLRGRIDLEGFLVGGPLTARFSYLTDRKSALLYSGNLWPDSPNFVENEGGGYLKEDGKGKGFVLDAGLRINYNITRIFGLFIETGYSYQVVNRLSGSGVEKRNDLEETWQGEWGIIEETVKTEWAEMKLKTPTNRQQLLEDHKIKDFKLNLSGFQLGIGIFLRF